MNGSGIALPGGQKHDNYGKLVLRNAAPGGWRSGGASVITSYGDSSAHIDGTVGSSVAVEIESRTGKQVRIVGYFDLPSATSHMNFIKIHRTLRVTPGDGCGLTDRLWDAADLVAAWEARERSVKRAA